MDLYFQYQDKIVTDESLDSYYEESFTASEGTIPGYLLYILYTTYDSYSHGTEKHCCVIDLYERFEDADKYAKLVADEKSVLNNEGNRAYYPCGWGTSFKEVNVLFVESLQTKREWSYY